MPQDTLKLEWAKDQQYEDSFASYASRSSKKEPGSPCPACDQPRPRPGTSLPDTDRAVRTYPGARLPHFWAELLLVAEGFGVTLYLFIQCVRGTVVDMSCVNLVQRVKRTNRTAKSFGWKAVCGRCESALMLHVMHL